MAISLKSIRYSNFGGDDGPYVLDVATLNDRRDWGLKVSPDDTWTKAKNQLALIDSISIAIAGDDAVTWSPLTFAPVVIEDSSEADFFTVENSDIADVVNFPPIPVTTLSLVEENVSFEQF